MTVQGGQVVVHVADHPAPRLLWTDDDVAQGLARSEGIVALGLPDHDAEVRLRVSCGGAARVPDTARWAITVPFALRGGLEAGTVIETDRLRVPKGDDKRVFAVRKGGGELAASVDVIFGCRMPGDCPS